MAAIYTPIRIAVLLLTGISLVMAIIDLVKLLDSNYRDSQAITSIAIIAVVLFIGAWGSWKNDRTYLLTFALILIIALIVGFTSKASVYGSLGLNVVTAILALSQAELIRRGYA